MIDTDRESICCYQVNMHNAIQANTELLNLMKNSNANVSLIQEPYTYRGNLGIKASGMAVFPNKKTGNPRTAIIASRHLELMEISDLNNEYATVVAGIINNKKIMFASMYLHGEREILGDGIRSIIEFSNKFNHQLIFAADANAHSSLWGEIPKRPCKRGEILEQFILENGLEIHNSGNTPTFRNKRCSSFIDVTITNNLNMALNNWHVKEEYNASDHNTISFELTTGTIKREPIKLWKKANWKKFNEILKEKPNAFVDQSELITAGIIETRLDEIYEKINDAADEAIPCFTPTGDNCKTNKWFNERCRNMRNSVAKLRRKYQRKNSERNWLAFTEKAKEYKDFCKTRQKENLRDFLETMPDIKSISQLHKNMVCQGRNEISSLLDKNNKRTLPGEETLNELINVHFPKHQVLTATKHPNKNVTMAELTQLKIDWINNNLIRKAMSGFKDKNLQAQTGSNQ